MLSDATSDVIQITAKYFGSDPQIVDAWLTEHATSTQKSITQELQTSTLRVENKLQIAYVIGFMGGLAFDAFREVRQH